MNRQRTDTYVFTHIDLAQAGDVLETWQSLTLTLGYVAIYNDRYDDYD